MKINKNSMLLYAVTDRTWLDGDSLENQVELAVNNGVTFLQLREKDLGFDEFVELAKRIKILANKAGVPFVINDNIDVAIASGADGVHLGQDDISADKAREILGDDKIIGISVQTVEDAVLAEKKGADYLGVGAVFSTSTKLDASDVSFETLREVCNAVSIPVVAIGGINKNNLLQLKGSGIDGVAVVSAIFAEKDIANATIELVNLCRQVVN
ncbi:MAG TPA: thiamine phosphate synthase [Clostridiales bacterium]|nr:thiamine phosphate synthase [Clostridiales bacterium]